MASRITALIVAAGQGLRSGGDLPKQYRRIGGKPVLAHAVDALITHPLVDAVQVVIGPGQEKLYAEAVGSRDLPPPVIGADARQGSVARGLAAITGEAVLIHDAARPFLPAEVVDRLAAALATADGAVPVLPVADTLAQADDSLGPVVPRAGLVRVQTPQAFRLHAIRQAHAAWNPDREATDDAQIARAAGLRVAVVDGAASLEKLTYAHDFEAAERRLATSMISRTGLGFDVHAFCEGDGVWMGGLYLPHGQGLSGHSDADVALHAITDALLGTIGAGDIGSHFPPTEPRWKGAASDRFLRHAHDLVRARGGRLDHVDVTIICEAPKIGPYREAIRRSVASILELAESQVSIKATTTEALGFTGRREGIAAQAVATIRLPEHGA